MLLTLFPHIALAVNLFLVLGLFFGLNRRIWKLRKRATQCEGQLQAMKVQLTEEIQALNRKLAELEASSMEPAAGSAPSLGSGLNTTLRSKVLKMHRLGQSMDHIADSLQVPKGEVDLLVKVHRIVMRSYTGAAETSTPERLGLKKS